MNKTIGSKLNRRSIFHMLKNHRKDLKQFQVKKIGLFGSYLRNKQNKKSDIDFLVELKHADFNNFMELSFFLEKLFGRKVDLVTQGSLSPYIKPYVAKEVAWYEA